MLPSAAKTASPQRSRRACADVGVLGQHGVAGAVGVQQAGAQVGEHLRHERLAARHAADEADGFCEAHDTHSICGRKDAGDRIRGTGKGI